MEYDKIKELISDMENSKLNSLDIEFPDGVKISMKKDNKVTTNITPDIQVKENKEIKEDTKQSKKEDNGNIVKSPMVGTFYLKPSPTADPYVELNKNVKKGNVLCVIEAMKLMNEIESEYDGKIVEIYVNDGECVEYGQPLFKIV